MTSLHIVSTGISLLTNFVRCNPANIRDLILENSSNYSHQIETFLATDPCKACGEINSLQDRTRFLDGGNPDLHVTLIYTETTQGKCVASLLEKFLKGKVGQVHLVPLKGFDKPATDATPDYARTASEDSLRALDTKVAEHVSKMKAQVGEIEMNVTGGFKAEAAVLYALGKRLGIPVYYMHESFKCCVTLPSITC